MPRREPPFENGEIYHITLRRIGGELLFKDIHDYYRGIFSIYEFNNAKAVSIRRRREERKNFKKFHRVPNSADSAEFGTRWTSGFIVEPDLREKLVESFIFCLMPNHPHLLLKQLKDGGISKYMQKFGIGLSGYLKDKCEIQNKGHFFQNSFNAVHIKTEDQLKTVFVYVHTNPVALIEPNWKEIGIKDPEKAIKFVEDYKWSSYQDYLGKKNFPSVTERKFLLEVMGGEQGCKDFVEDWLRYKGEIREFPELALEN